MVVESLLEFQVLGNLNHFLFFFPVYYVFLVVSARVSPQKQIRALLFRVIALHVAEPHKQARVVVRVCCGVVIVVVVGSLVYMFLEVHVLGLVAYPFSLPHVCIFALDGVVLGGVLVGHNYIFMLFLVGFMDGVQVAAARGDA